VKKIVIVGAGGHCRSVMSTIQNLGKSEVFGIVDISYKGIEEMIMGKPVIGGIDVMKKLDTRRFLLVLAVGDNQKRKLIETSLQKNGFEFPNLIHPRSFVDRTARMGKGNIVSCFAYVGPMVNMGDFNIINTGVILEHEVTLGDFNHVAPCSTVCGRVKVSDQVLLGANSVVLPNIGITSEVILGANSTLIRDASKTNITLIGNPAVEK
jgi:UDP-perosamine 4-acetyltransferase